MLGVLFELQVGSLGLEPEQAEHDVVEPAQRVVGVARTGLVGVGPSSEERCGSALQAAAAGLLAAALCCVPG